MYVFIRLHLWSGVAVWHEPAAQSVPRFLAYESTNQSVKRQGNRSGCRSWSCLVNILTLYSYCYSI